MPGRTILHVDCNSFFCSVSLLYKPWLRGRPVAVGGDPETRHGIILAKNPEAKKYGIRTGSALWEAMRLCPELIILPPEYERIKQCSGDVKAIFAEYTDKMEPFGSDESWLDVTGSTGLFGDGEKIAHTIRERVKREIGITVSVGVSWNKIFAKLGSDMKKPDAVTVISKDNFRDTVWPLPAEELLYVGPATTWKLHKMGIYTIGALAQMETRILRDWFGVIGEALWSYANGYENTAVGGGGPPIKSVGNSSVIDHDVTCNGEVKQYIHVLSESVGPRMRAEGLAAQTIEVWICDNDMGYLTRQRGMPIPSNLNYDLATAAYSLFLDTYHWKKPIRKIGIRGSNLVFDSDPYQCSFEQGAERRERREKLEAAMDWLNGRFPHSVTRAVTMYEGKLEDVKTKEAQRQFSPVGWLK